MLTESSPDTIDPPPFYVDFSCMPSTSVGEIHFGDMGPRCARQGWAVFPQEKIGRKPGVVDGEMLKWSRYQSVAPSIKDVDRWSRQALGLNVAAIMGEASSLIFAIDIDVTDVNLSEDIQLEAMRTLGETKFQRIGNWPKIVLIYRVATREDLPANRSYSLVDKDGAAASGQAIEIQAQGKAVTIHGRHHGTGDRFTWPTGKMPTNCPPTFAPIVTPAALEDFLGAVQDLRPFTKQATGGAGLEGLDLIETDGVRTVALARADGAQWVLRDGLVADGRETYLTRLAFETVRVNPLLCSTPAGISQLKKVVLDAFRATAVLDGHWKTVHLARSVSEKIGRNARQLLAGDIQVSRRALKPVATPETTARKAAAAITAPEAERITMEMEDRVDAFLSDAVGYAPDGEEMPPFHLLKSPVGTGKTTTALKRIAQTVALEMIQRRKAEMGSGGTFLMLAPMHDNVNEVVEKAIAMGLKAEAHRGQAHPEGGCAKRDTVQLLQEAGISAARLCESVVDGGTIYCEHNPAAGGDCPRMAAIARMLDNDVVVSVHAFGTQSPPEPFRKMAAVVVDEDFVGQLTRTATIQRAILGEKRRDISPTKAERQALWGDRTPTDEELQDFDNIYAIQRVHLVALCDQAWDEGRDPARDIAGNLERKSWLEAALTITSRAGRIAADISPVTTVREAAELASQMRGRDIGLEGRLWRMMSERVALVERATALVQDGNPVVCRDRDDRIWAFRDAARRVQLSWTTEYALSELPTMFMDASANPNLLARALDRPLGSIVCRPVQANLRIDVTLIDDSTYSKTRYLPKPAPLHNAEKRQSDARMLTWETQALLAKVSAIHGNGGTLVVAPKAVEELLQKDWTLPNNMSSLHYGATAGLDFAKHHSAAVLIGALYPDAETIDGLVAALTWQDDEAVERMDPDGCGKAVDPFEILDESVPMRDGTFHPSKRMEYRGAMANAILEQIRDEGLTQALGRLRVVFREDIPRLYILGNTVPRGLIVDRVSTMQAELADLGRLFSAAHRNDGLISAELADKSDLTVQFRRFQARIDADPAFAKAFHMIRKPGGERVWMPGHIEDELVTALAEDWGAAFRLVSRKSYGRPPAKKTFGELSEKTRAILNEIEIRKMLAVVPLETRNRIRAKVGGEDAERMLLDIAVSMMREREVEVEEMRRQRAAAPAPEIDDPFDRISDEALAIPIDW